MLGPSGSGKTTTLRLIAGFERPDEGGRARRPRRLEAAAVLTRRQHGLPGLRALPAHDRPGERRVRAPGQEGAAGERRQRAAEALSLVRLEGYGGRKPSQLSGGQRRVALARAIVNRPQALLLDEPLGALDLKLARLQVELKRIQQELGITFVYVTHDQEEALTMSDRLAVFNDGRIAQLGAPAEVYEHPASEFIAGFVGVSNVLDRDGRRFTVRPEKVRLLGEASGARRRRRGGADRERRLRRRDLALPPRARRGRRADGGDQNLERGSSEVQERQGRRVRASWLPEHAFQMNRSNGGENE